MSILSLFLKKRFIDLLPLTTHDLLYVLLFVFIIVVILKQGPSTKGTLALILFVGFLFLTFVHSNLKLNVKFVRS